MITKLYDQDQLLVENAIGNEVTFLIQDPPTNEHPRWNDYMTLSNEQIVAESMEIKQSICDNEELEIGGCIPSRLKLKVMNISEDLSGKRIVVRIRSKYYSEVLYPNSNLTPSADVFPYQQLLRTGEYLLFVGQIYSYKKTQNKNIRELIAFDRLCYGSTVLCKNKLYNYLYSIWNDPNNVGVDIKLSTIANKLFALSGIDAPDSSNFINWNELFEIDDNLFQKVIDEKFTALEGLKWLCEINGIYLIDDTMSTKHVEEYRSTANIRVVAPYKNIANKYLIESYSDLEYDDFLTKQIRFVQFFSNPNGSRCWVYESNHENFSHYLSDNPLTQCLGSNSQLMPLIKNLDARWASDGAYKIAHNVYIYRPFRANIFNRWWVQVGDRVKLPTTDEDVPYVTSIVFSKTIRGINSMNVEIEAKGVEVLGKENDDERVQ